MKRTILTVAALCAFSTLLNVNANLNAKPKVVTRAPSVTPRERSFSFEYKTTVKDIPAGAKRVELWIPVPHDSPLQTIKGLTVESPYPYKIHSMKYGNRALHLTVENPSQTSFNVTMRFDAVRFEHVKERLSDASEAAKDPQRREYFFGAHDENRVEFTRGRDLTLSPRQKGEPLNYFVYPYAEVDGKPFNSVERVVSYKDQPAPTNAPTGGVGM